MSIHADSVLRFGRCEIRPQRREVFVAGQPVTLEPRTFDVLLHLIAHRDRVVSKRELLTTFWHTTAISDGVIAKIIMKARHALGVPTIQPDLIRTVHRVGYQFVGELEIDRSHLQNPGFKPVSRHVQDQELNRPAENQFVFDERVALSHGTGMPAAAHNDGAWRAEQSLERLSDSALQRAPDCADVVAPPAPFGSVGRPALTRVARFALLPFENRTADARLGWIELGLMSMVAKMVAAATGIVVASTRDTLLAVKHLPRDASSHARILALHQGAGIDDVLTAALSHESDRYVLRWSISRMRGTGATGVLYSVEPTRLAIEAGEEIVAALSGARKDPRAVVFPKSLEFENQAFARALQAIEEERYCTALDHLQICASSRGYPVQVDVEMVHVLAALSDNRTAALGERVLAKLHDADDHAGLVRVFLSLAEYRVRRGENRDLAKDHADEAMARLARLGDREASVRALNLRATIAIHDREFDTARLLLHRASSIADRLHSPWLSATTTLSVGRAESSEGNLAAAIACFERAVDLCRVAMLHTSLATALCGLAFVLSRSGRYLRTQAIAEEALYVARRHCGPGAIALALRILCMNSILRGQYADAARYHEQTCAPALNRFALARAYSDYLAAMLAMARGERQQAQSYFDAAEPVLRRYGYAWYNFILTSRIDLSVSTGDLERASKLVCEFEGHPRFPHDRHLRACAALGRGLIARACGARADALRILRAGLHDASPDDIFAQIAGHCVWLYAEAVELTDAGVHVDADADADAETMLAALGPWIDDNPNGLATRARLLAARGDFSGALRDQNASLAILGSEAPRAFQRLRDAYQSASDRSQSEPLANLDSVLRPL